MKLFLCKALLYSAPYLFTLFLVIPIRAQSIERQVVSSAGSTYTQGEYTLDFTLGEFMTTTGVNGDELSQGFHQVWAVVTAIGDVVSDLETKIYPNPVQEILNIESVEKISVQVFDLQGRMLMNQLINPGTTSMDIHELSIGTYIICMSDDMGARVKNFKLVKVE